MLVRFGYLIGSRPRFSNRCWMTGCQKFLWKVNKLRESTQAKLLYIDKELPSDPEVIFKSHVSRSVSEFGAMDVDT